MMSNGAAIKARLKALDMTQSEACDRSGLSTGFLSDVINDKKRLGAEGARRLAPVLGMSITELLGESTGELEEWFWPVRFTSLSVDGLRLLRHMTPEERISWTLREVQDAYPDMDLAERCNLTPGLIQELLAGTAIATEAQMTLLTKNLMLPPQFLLAGEPGPNTDLARKILGHPNATEWLTVIDYAIENEVPPITVMDVIRSFLRAVKR